MLYIYVCVYVMCNYHFLISFCSNVCFNFLFTIWQSLIVHITMCTRRILYAHTVENLSPTIFEFRLAFLHPFALKLSRQPVQLHENFSNRKWKWCFAFGFVCGGITARTRSPDPLHITQYNSIKNLQNIASA